MNSNSQKIILARFLIRPILDPKFPLMIRSMEWTVKRISGANGERESMEGVLVAVKGAPMTDERREFFFSI